MTATDTTAPHPLLDKILSEQGEALESSHLFQAALREIMPAAEHWVGRDIVLECDTRGWSIRYTHGNNYRDRLTDSYGARFVCAEDAIQALHELTEKERARIEREDAKHA